MGFMRAFAVNERDEDCARSGTRRSFC
jgi:hypothetical protein